MASLSVENPRPPNPLYIFYDCEATGLEAHQDRIIELAAVVSLRGSSTREGGMEKTFQSLCHSEREIGPVAREMTGLTNRDLRNKPRLPEVLHSFLDWVSDMASRVTRERGKRCTPVLVAHGGFSLDFPMLMAGVERASGGQSVVFSHPLYRKIETLNLHFGDSYTTCKHLAEKSDPILAGIEKKGQESLYQRFFHEEYDTHRALGDARALHRLFTQSPLRHCLDQLIMKSPQAAFNHWKAIQLTTAGVTFGKAKSLVKSGVYLEHMQQQYNRSPLQFPRYLRSLGINRPSLELLTYFETHN